MLLKQEKQLTQFGKKYIKFLYKLKIDDSKITIDKNKIEEEFCSKKKEEQTKELKKDEKKEDKNSKPQLVSVLQPPRQQNINIVLGKVRIDVMELIEALISFNEKILSLKVCELLM